MISLEEMAIPLEGENPAGENLEYDSLYLEMDSLAVAVPDNQMGESKIEGRGPDWKKLRENCLSLWSRTRDLRVASYLTVTETADGSLKDCVAAFKLILFTIRDMWDTVYPRLDPDDDNDPTERINILNMLSPEPGAFNDPIMFISKFRALRLVPALPYTLRDHLISINEFEAADGRSVDSKLIAGEVMCVHPEEVEKQAALTKELRETVEAICAAANEKLSDGYSLSMNSLLAEIGKLGRFYAGHLQSPDGGKNVDGDKAEEMTGDPGNETAAAMKEGSVNLAAYMPANRADALLLLRKGSEYFLRNEPNSPIPLLINRALRISDMNFMDILKDIAPDALPQGRNVLGVQDQ